jgi:hypothetical protein
LTRLSFAFLTLGLVAGCGGSPPPAPATGGEPASRPSAGPQLLTEITGELGLPEPQPWPDGTFFVPEIMGPGLALFDHDGDGDLDLLQARVPRPGERGTTSPNRLYEQLDDGSFRDSTEQTGLGDTGFGQAIATGDIDNDGDTDVYVANFGHDALYENNGAGGFREVTTPSGIAGEHWSTAATFCDYDRDDDLDLFVVHYLRIDYAGGCRTDSGVDDYCGPGSFDGQADTLYRNDGEGRFTDVTETAGIRSVEGGRRAKGLGVVCLDLTGDGRPDIYVANDGEANQFWVGRPDGSFVDEAIMRGVAINRHGRPEASMGLTVGDVDGDGQLDLLSTHLAGENNTLYMGGGTLFRDQTAESGMVGDDRGLTGFGCGFFDLELDGDLDLAVVNGDVRIDSDQASEIFWNRYSEPNLLFRNDGTGRFANVSDRTGSFASTVETTRGLAFGDLDGDGDLDFVTSNVDNTLRAYRNDAPPPGTHWLIVRALTGRRDALSAVVTVTAGARAFVAPVLANASYQSASDPRAHFGLGSADTVEHVDVLWPDGSRERFTVDGVDREIVLRRGTGTEP